jgi:hypothetical protein
MIIPFIDLHAQCLTSKSEMDAAIADGCRADSGSFDGAVFYGDDARLTPK